MVVDTREVPPGLDDFRRAHPQVELHCGVLTALDMSEAAEIVVSPGVDLRTPGLAEWVGRRRDSGEPLVVGEIALFVRAASAPIAAITGSNAKSTVTTLLGEMAQAAGRRVAVGGNLGTPALDLLAEVPEAELYVLELSSFQLETTPGWAPRRPLFSISPKIIWIATTTWRGIAQPSWASSAALVMPWSMPKTR